jgi:DNA-binding response OmpR family regulator
LASSGKKALQYIAASPIPYDCLLLDIQMPEMDGIELCKKIRAIDGYEETPVIMVTAMSDTKYVEAAFIAGATDYVTKPFDVLELGSRIKMAERLIKSRAALKVKADKATRLQDELNSKYRSEYVNPISARNIQGLIEFDIFEQKLTMFSKKERLNSSVYAVKLVSANEIFGQLLASEQKLLVQEITLAIVESLPAEGSFVAYRGNGIFVCVSKKVNRNSGINFEHNLSRAVKKLTGSVFGAQQSHIRLSVGKSVPRIMSSPQPITMIAEAIEDAEKTRYRAVA